MIGGFGDAEVFSFHATKIMNTFEGGCITTNNDELAHNIRLMKNFGFAGNDNVVHIGTNGKMSEISAAMGLVSLKELDTFIEHNRQNYEQYKKGIQAIDGLSIVAHCEQPKANYHYAISELAPDAGIKRDTIVNILQAENILARRYFYPGCHRMEPYRSFYPNAGLLLPVTERLTEILFCLPNGMATSVEDVARITELLAFIMKNKVEITKRLVKSN
jgi:dTDP-4-amino-4,6-dideoxygalactose transaminase